MKRLPTFLITTLLTALSVHPCTAGETYNRNKTISIAVFNFKNLTGNEKLNWLGNGFAEAVSNKLSRVDMVALYDRRMIADSIRNMKLGLYDIDAANATGTGREVGVDYVIFGSIRAAGNADKPDTPLRAAARMVEVATGKVYRAVEVDGIMCDVFDLQSRMTIELAELLNLNISRAAKKAMKHCSTNSIEAYCLYCQGLEKLDNLQFDEAVKLFKEAGIRHKGVLYADAHHALGQAFLRSDRKKEMLREFSGDVKRLSPIWFNLGLAYENAGEYEKAADAFKTFIKYTDRRFTPWKYEGKGHIISENVMSGGRVMLFDRNNQVHCLDATSGRLYWKKKTTPPAYNVSMCGSYAYFTTKSNELIAVNIMTGAIRWSVKVADPISSPVELMPEIKMLFLGTATGKLTAFSMDKGELLWAREVGHAIEFVECSEQYVYAAGGKDYLLSLGAKKGKILWKRPATAKTRQMTACSNLLLVTDTSGRLGAIDIFDGSEKWSVEGINNLINIECRNDRHLAISADGKNVICLSRKGGEVWRKDPGFVPEYVIPIGGQAAILSKNGRITILSMDDGRIIERRNLGSEISGASVSGYTLLVDMAEGGVQAFGFSNANDEPQDREAYLQLASSLRSKGDLIGAEEAYRVLLQRIDPKNLRALHGLAELCKLRGDAETEKELLRKAAQIRAENK